MRTLTPGYSQKRKATKTKTKSGVLHENRVSYESYENEKLRKLRTRLVLTIVFLHENVVSYDMSTKKTYIVLYVSYVWRRERRDVDVDDDDRRRRTARFWTT